LDQDRPAKELRLAGIDTVEEANRFLLKTCLPRMSGKFPQPAFDPANARVPPGKAGAPLPKEILCFEHERAVTNDYADRFECRLFQIPATSKALPRTKDKVIVRIRLDGSLGILRKGKILLVEELPKQNKVKKSLGQHGQRGHSYWLLTPFICFLDIYLRVCYIVGRISLSRRSVWY
jgi:hypothetical protein